jgi:alpha-methylacyl-CoA racemase
MFRARTRDEWVALLGSDDTCVAPVLDWDEAPTDPHNAARETFVTIDGVVQPAPAPRFSATPGAIQAPPPAIGADNQTALADWGFGASAIEALEAAGAL